jgi:hypothetical protein
MTDDESPIKAAFGRLVLPEAPERLRGRLADIARAQPTVVRARRLWASVAAVAVALALLLLGLAVLGPGATPSPAPSQLGDELARYDTGVFSFSYPAVWRTFGYHVDSSFSHTLVYLATVDVPEPCETTQASEYTRVDCQDRWTLGPDDVVVVVSAEGRPGFDIANVPPGAGSLSVDGQPGYLEKGTAPTGDPMWTWTFANPDAPDNYFTVRATFRGPDAGAISAELFALVASIGFDAPSVASPVPTSMLSPVALPNPGGTCTASQFVLGTAQAGYTFSVINYRHAYFLQPLRNLGSGCVLSVPKVIGVASLGEPLQAVTVNNIGNEVCVNTSCHYVTPPTYTIRPGQTLDLYFNVSWFEGATDENGTPLDTPPPCVGEVKDVSSVSFPVAIGSILIDLEAATQAGSSVPWRAICSSPTNISFEIKAK